MVVAREFVVLLVGIALALQGCGGGGGGTPSPTPAPTGPPTTTVTATTTTVTVSSTTTTTTEPSPFEKYVIDYPDDCKPWLSRSNCSDAEYKGLVFFFHGYSACANQVEGLAPALNNECFDVATPTFPGHGKTPIHDCNAQGAKCTVRWSGEGGNMGFDLSEVPTHSSGYFAFADSMVELIKSEHEYRAKHLNMSTSDLQLAIGGLSTGGALAAYTNSKHPGVFSKMLLINPYFGAGQAAVDEKMRHLSAARLAEANILQTLMPTLALASDDPETVLAGTNDLSLHKDITQGLNQVTAWDSDCVNIFHHGRMGFCAFQGKHAGAAHSVGMHALVEALSQPSVSFPKTQIITTEQDGMTNNGWTYSLGRHIHEASYGDVAMVGMCMYRFKPGVDRSDAGQYYNTNNVVPHANLDPHDNPKGMWWKESLYGQMATFLSGSSVVLSPEKWDNSREQCVGLPFGSGAFGLGSWLNSAVLPGVTPSTSALGPDGMQLLLNFDNVVRIPCWTPLVKQVMQQWVDCSVLGTEQRSDNTYIQV